MPFRQTTCHLVGLMVVPLILVTGCAQRRLPLVSDPRLREVHTVTLMPIVDARRDRDDAIDPQGDVLGPITTLMQEKGYRVVVAPAFAEELSLEELAELGPTELATLGPKEAQALMFVRVLDLFSRYVVMAYTAKADVEGVLVDPASGETLWRDKGVVSFGQGGLLSALDAAVSNPLRGAVLVLMQSVPSQGATR